MNGPAAWFCAELVAAHSAMVAVVASAALVIAAFFIEKVIRLFPVFVSRVLSAQQRVRAAMLDTLGHVILRHEPVAFLRHVLACDLMGNEDPAPQIAIRCRRAHTV